MTYEDKVLEYIAQPENLPVALEVADAVQTLKDTIHKQFWPLFSAELNQRLMNSEYVEKWQYHPFPSTRLKTEYENSYLQPVEPKGIESPVLRIIFGQGGRDNHYRLVLGVAWGRNLPDPDHPALKDLKKELIKHKLTGVWDWRPGWKHLPYALEGGEFMVKFYHTPNEVVEELVEEYWQLFLNLRPIVEPINYALAQ